MKDPEFLAEARKLNLDINPVSGMAITSLLAELRTSSKRPRKRFRSDGSLSRTRRTSHDPSDASYVRCIRGRDRELSHLQPGARPKRRGLLSRQDNQLDHRL